MQANMVCWTSSDKVGALKAVFLYSNNGYSVKSRHARQRCLSPFARAVCSFFTDDDADDLVKSVYLSINSSRAALPLTR